MTILYPSPRRVKRSRPFGSGILRSIPVYRAPFTAEDVTWWTLECSTAEGRHYDQLAGEAEAVERSTRGTLL